MLHDTQVNYYICSIIVQGKRRRLTLAYHIPPQHIRIRLRKKIKKRKVKKV